MRTTIGVAVSFCALLSACGGGSSEGGNEAAPATETASASATDPCSLVTTEEVAAATGETIVGSEAAEGICTYQTDDAMASSVTIELNQSDAAGAMSVARQASGALQDIGGAVAGERGAGADTNAMLADAGETPKIGDEAFFGQNQQLHVRKGNSYIAVSPPMMRSRMSTAGNPMLSSDDKKKMAIAIAEKAVARLL